MELENKPAGAKPDYKGEGVAVWIKEDKNGKKYLSITVLNNIHVAAFKYEPREPPVRRKLPGVDE